MSLEAGCVRVVDCTPISSEFLGRVVDWQSENAEQSTADKTWLELRCTYESEDGQEMALATGFSQEVRPGDLIDVAAAPVVGMRFSDDFSKPPAQLAVAPVLQQRGDRWVVVSPA